MLYRLKLFDKLLVHIVCLILYTLMTLYGVAQSISQQLFVISGSKVD